MVMHKFKRTFIVLTALLLSISCSREAQFKRNLPEAEPLNIEQGPLLGTKDDAISFEQKKGSHELKFEFKWKVEWLHNVTHTSSSGPYDYGITIFQRTESSLKGYFEAVVYSYFTESNVDEGEFKLFEEIHYYYPDDNFFGYYKNGYYQSPRKVIHNLVEDVPEKLFLRNYHSVLLWMESLENERFIVVREPCYIDGVGLWRKVDRKKGRVFKLEEPWIEEVLFYSYNLVDMTDETPIISFKANPYAPIETYAVYGDDDVYPLHYSINIEDLTFWITIDKHRLPNLPLNIKS